ncbi:MAG: TRAP transporter small permease [Acidimicrobiia bacterium]|nr:TRAP transporter small permease [Acidimicrobiia bacterium]NNL28335.1 TRAP transporter small permease [Acidimicrobiia bacterium]NNL47122.1 TRAP transporter small permease [Acidimicrobiia bacterium]
MHYLAGITLMGMLALTIADITGRTVFNNPVPGTVEVTSLILVIVVFFGLAHSEDLGDHITVDLIYVRAGKRTKMFLDVFSDLLGVVVLGLMAFQLYHFGLRQLETGAESPVLEWPVWPFVYAAAVGAVFYGVATAMRLTLRLMGDKKFIESEMMGESPGVEI